MFHIGNGHAQLIDLAVQRSIPRIVPVLMSRRSAGALCLAIRQLMDVFGSCQSGQGSMISTQCAASIA